MFTKKTGKLESVIGAHSDLTGELHVQGTLRIDGRLNGRIEADWVVLSETAVVKGDIQARRIIVGGAFEGTLKARELVEIKSKGKCVGEIFTAKFSVMEGGIFDGRIEMQAEEAKVIEFQPAGPG